jgi:glucan phosphoethanolaminetransferase (alkaline phosphatase superfamily)
VCVCVCVLFLFGLVFVSWLVSVDRLLLPSFLLIFVHVLNVLYSWSFFVGFACQGKDTIVFRFIIEYSSLRDFGSYIIISLFSYEDFLKDEILACVET